MHGIDTSCAAPGIIKLRRTNTTDAVTGITRRAIRQIAAPHQHCMGGAVMLSVTNKVAAVANSTFATRGVTGSTPLKILVRRAVTGLTPLLRMNLTHTGKRCRSSGMAACAIGGIRRSCRINLYRCPMVVTMSIKVRGMTGLTGLSSTLAGSIAYPLAASGAVAGRTTKATMGLP